MFQIKILQFLSMVGGLYILSVISSCDFSSETEKEDDIIVFTDTISVTASAYNSLQRQGEGNVNITAWGDTLVPGMKSIAVSRDLLRKGLTHGTPVAIEGFDDFFVVNDKMHPRWRNKIDIYMGVDKAKAKEWGRRKLKISFPGKEPDEAQQ
ncbi:3D domain-containing protein [Salinimicrobium sp. GXAS 041]|uniref:3D domain-containing protein n=1 Tax=Salinimicrobium sp. GXAS 041 TaxID=3400806 RepID=UPI003C77100D